jgi:hypothetical protein
VSLLLLLQNAGGAPGNVTAEPTAASLTLSGGTPAVATPVATQPTAASLTLSGGTPAVTAPALAEPTAASLTLAGDTPDVAAYTGPVWTTPGDGIPMSSTPTLAFYSPVAAVNQHFNLQLDTAATFATGDLRDLSSESDQTGWTYWTGGTWAPITAVGLPLAFSGNEVRHDVQTTLAPGIWYRRVRAGS